MWLQKKINKRLIKRAIGSEYVYQIEADERIKKWLSIDDEDYKPNKIKSFLEDWVKEMRKEVKKKLGE
jgi:hypothetical protein